LVYPSGFGTPSMGQKSLRRQFKSAQPHFAPTKIRHEAVLTPRDL